MVSEGEHEGDADPGLQAVAGTEAAAHGPSSALGDCLFSFFRQGEGAAGEGGFVGAPLRLFEGGRFEGAGEIVAGGHGGQVDGDGLEVLART